MSHRFTNKSNLSYQLSEQLGRQIVSGTYLPEDPLPTEAELCSQFGASRTAVREAVKILTAKGLVTSKPRRGIRVLPPDIWNYFDSDVLSWALQGSPSPAIVKEFFQLRVAIEPEAAVLATRFGNEDQKNAIVAAFERMQKSSTFADDAVTSDLDFHTAVLFATNNRFFIRMKDFIRAALNITVQHTTPANWSYEEVLVSHERVVRAIVNGNVERARLNMRVLIEDALMLLDSDETVE